MGPGENAGPLGSRFARHKYVSPPTVQLIERPRLVDSVVHADIVLVGAPYGYGKTSVASQIAQARAEPVAWFTADDADCDTATVVGYLLRALGEAWPDLDGYTELRPDWPRGALAFLGYVLEELAGPGTVVLDDLHTLTDDVLRPMLGVLTHSLPPDFHLVLSSRGSFPIDVAKLESTGRAVGLGPSDLLFTDREVRLLLDGIDHARVFEQARGWPLAVGLYAARVKAGKEAALGPRRADLVRPLLHGLSSDVLAALGLMTKLARVPVDCVGSAVPANVFFELERLAAQNPIVLSETDDGWWSASDLVREAVGNNPGGSHLAVTLACSLDEAGHVELAVQLLVRAGEHEAAVATLDRRLKELAWTGDWAKIRTCLKALPPEDLTPALRFADAAIACAEHLRHDGTTEPATAPFEALWDLHDDVWRHGDHDGLYASAILASLLVLKADVRAFGVAIGGCAHLRGAAVVDESDLERLVAQVPAEDADLVGLLLQAAGFGLLLTAQPAGMHQGRRVLDLARTAFARAGRVATAASLRGLYLATDALMGGLDADLAIVEIESALSTLARCGAERQPQLLDGLMGLYLRTRRFDEASRVAAELLNHAERSDAGHFRLHAEQALVVIGVAQGDEAAAAAERSERIWTKSVAMTPERASAWAVDLAHAYLDAGDVHSALPWQTRARVEHDRVGYVRFEREALAARLEIIAGAEPETGVDEIEALAGRRVAGGLPADVGRMVARAAHDLHRRGLPARAEQMVGHCPLAIPPAWRDFAKARSGRDVVQGTSGARATLRIRLLAPAIMLERDGVELPAPRGYGARLLALLVAARGPIQLDRVLEELWPEIDPDVSRKRFRCVLHRLRHTLGFNFDGPIVSDAGMIRLTPADDVSVDVWEFMDATHPSGDCAAHGRALEMYTDHFCSAQFAYEDFADDARREMRQRLAVTATSYFCSALDNRAGPLDDVVASAVRIWRLVPEDEELCLTVAELVARGSRYAQVIEILEGTEKHLANLGLDTTSLRRRGATLLT